MKNVNEIIAFNIRRLRKEKGLSQAELGEAAGFSGGGIQYIETNKRIPREETIIAIAGALNVPVSALYEGIVIEKESTASQITKKDLADALQSTVKQLQGLSLTEDEKNLILAIRSYKSDQLTKNLGTFLVMSPQLILSALNLRHLIPEKFRQALDPKNSLHKPEKTSRKARS